MTAPWLQRPDAVSVLLGCAESLRAAARTIESLELGAPEARDDLRDLLASIRRSAFVAVSLGAGELGPPSRPGEYSVTEPSVDSGVGHGRPVSGVAIGRVKRDR